MPSSRAHTGDIKLLDPFWREPVERQVLPNGLTLIVKPDYSAQLASVQVWVKTGSIHENAWLGSGISHFLEHMLFKGTERRNGRQISAEVQAHGGYINAYTTFDRTVYYIDLPSEHLPVAVDVLSDAVLNSTLPAEEVIKERDVILREIAMTKDDPDQRLGEALFETVFRVHPYRHPIIGHRDVFTGLTRDDLWAYYKERYVPNNIVVVVAGAVEPAKVREEVERRFGQAPRTRLAPVLVPEEPVQLASRVQHRVEDTDVCRAGIAWRIPGLTHPDAPALDLLATVLGSGESSVLWQRIREQAKLVHSIDAHSWNPGSTGLFMVSFTCDPDKRLRATEAVLNELTRLTKVGFTQVQIRKAVRQLAVGEINTRKTMSGQASRLGSAEVVVGDLQFGRGFFERLGEVGSAGLKKILREYVVPQRMTEVSSGPEIKTPTKHSPVRGPGASDEFEEIRLRNGARIVFQPDHRLPSLHFRLLCHGGPMFEVPGKRGASALLSTLLTKDTKKHSALDIAHYIESVGGSFYPFSGNNSMGLAAEVLSTDTARALRVLREAAFAPAFKPATFALERDSQLADLRLDSDDVVTLGRKLIRRRFFGDYPLSLDAHGDEAGVSALRPEDMASLHKRLFCAPNLVLAVSGDFKPSHLLPQLRDLMEEAPRGVKAALPAPFEAPAAGEWEEKQPREQAVVFQAFPGPSILVDDFYLSEVADELFSGMASRLFERVREEKGMAYFVRSTRVTGLNSGMFAFYAGTSPEKVADVLHEIENEIDRVASCGVEAAELERCKVRLMAGRRQSMQTSSARAFNAGLNTLFGLPANDWKNYDSRVGAVSAAGLADFANKYLKKEYRTQLVVKP